MAGNVYGLVILLFFTTYFHDFFIHVFLFTFSIRWVFLYKPNNMSDNLQSSEQTWSKKTSALYNSKNLESGIVVTNAPMGHVIS